jgi:hypothetical protein
LEEATNWLEEYRRLWERNFERLDSLLEELKAAELASQEINNITAKQEGEPS